MRRSKYNAVRTQVDGFTFASRYEAEQYAKLAALKRSGEIVKLDCQVRFPLNGISPDGKAEKVSTYVADFVVQFKDGTTVVFDAKGFRNRLYLLKSKWFAIQYGVKIVEL